jgi:hypothetical protein
MMPEGLAPSRPSAGQDSGLRRDDRVLAIARPVPADGARITQCDCCPPLPAALPRHFA